ncbi:STAS domain-containing protein [Azospirillum thermophilum]|uniref:Anti-sigma factor antagonist n=1 Tax=Azospirillum thermophilum TaxID=2202148 RepID=A0A2S2CRU8_9PROT|nr:STAS domain-containing protein [Azospirillum thermophilum]AWK87206.1 anti-sigma factor antagonist [Azospirillum thermophilum]
MNISKQTVGSVTVLKAEGRIDSSNAAEFETHLVEAVGSSASRVVVDMEPLTYISSAGLRSLLVAAKRARPAGGRIALAAMAPHIREVFDLSGFSSLFEIHGKAEEAVAALS